MTEQLFAPEIRVNPDIIRLLGRKLYTYPTYTILVRELLQNARDATPKGKITINAEYNDRVVKVECDDQGVGMDEDTLLNVFLMIGKSGKTNDTNAVGGFGIAKVALFSMDAWYLHTRNIELDSKMVMKNVKTRKGTVVRAAIEMESNSMAYDAHRRAKMLVFSSSVKNVIFNGTNVKPYNGTKELYNDGTMRVSAARPLDTESGIAETGLVFYRIGGLTQFYRTLGWDRYSFNIIVDFDGIGYRPTDNAYPFSMSREGVQSEYETTVREATQRYGKNKRTAESEIVRSERPARKQRENVRQWSRNRIIVDGPTGPIPQTHRHILKTWEILISQMDPQARVGLVYTMDCTAQHRFTGGHDYILINPKLFAGRLGSLKDVVAESALAIMWQLAVHELSHIIFSDHDEDFTGRETEIAAATAHVMFGSKMSSMRWLLRTTYKLLIEESTF